MLCSISELELTDRDMPGASNDGIFILPDAGIEGVSPGDDIAAALRMRDVAVEFEITPNRPDCLSVMGLAREAAATLGKNRTVIPRLYAARTAAPAIISRFQSRRPHCATAIPPAW